MHLLSLRSIGRCEYNECHSSLSEEGCDYLPSIHVDSQSEHHRVLQLFIFSRLPMTRPRINSPSWNYISNIGPAPPLATKKATGSPKSSHLIRYHCARGYSTQKSLQLRPVTADKTPIIAAWGRTDPTKVIRRQQQGKNFKSSQNGYRSACFTGQGFGLRFERPKGMPGAQSHETE